VLSEAKPDFSVAFGQPTSSLIVKSYRIHDPETGGLCHQEVVPHPQINGRVTYLLLVENGRNEQKFRQRHLVLHIVDNLMLSENTA
jgi:hypothetical protein